MSYTPTEWKAGDTVTSAKLNKIEQGVATSCGDNIFIVHEDENGVLDKTWAEIHSAIASGKIVNIPSNDEIYAYTLIIGMAVTTNQVFNLYELGYGPTTNDPVYIADSADGYPRVNET